MTATIIPLSPRPKDQPVNLRVITLLRAAHDNADYVAEFADDAREAHVAGRCFVDRPGMLDPATRAAARSLLALLDIDAKNAALPLRRAICAYLET